MASAKPVGTPPDGESTQEAEKRIAEMASSKDCATVNELNPISRPAFSTEDRCKILEIVATDPIDAAQYGDAGGSS